MFRKCLHFICEANAILKYGAVNMKASVNTGGTRCHVDFWATNINVWSLQSRMVHFLHMVHNERHTSQMGSNRFIV